MTVERVGGELTAVERESVSGILSVVGHIGNKSQL